MSDEGTLHLGVTTDANDAVAQVGRAMADLQGIFQRVGEIGNVNVGGEVIAGLQQMVQVADGAGTRIEEVFAKIVEGSAKLSEIKGPQTLGGLIGGVVQQLKQASEQFGSTPGANDLLGGAIEQQIHRLEAIKGQAERALAGFKELGLPQAGELERFLNPSQIARTQNAAAPFLPPPAQLNAEQQAAQQRQRTAEATATAEGQEERNLKALLDLLLQIGAASKFTDRAGNQFVQADLPTGRIRERYPTELPVLDSVPDLGASRAVASQADIRRDEEEAYRAEERRLAQSEKDSLALTRQQQGVNRAHQGALTEDQRRVDQVLQEARFAAYQSGESGYSRVGRSSFFNTPEGPSKLTGFGLDTNLNVKEMQGALDAMSRSGQQNAAELEKLAQSTEQARVANEQRQRAEDAYTQLLKANTDLQGLEKAKPGFRDLGGYVQLNDMLLKRTQAGLEEITSVQDLYKAEIALARAISSEGYTHAGATRSPFDAFLGGAFGHGFDSHQTFDPKSAINNLASTAGVLARYGYEFKIIQGALDGVKASFRDFAQVQDTLIDLDAVTKTVGADQLDLSAAFGQSSDNLLSVNDQYVIATSTLATYRDEIAAGADANTVFRQSVEAVGQAMILTGQSADQANRNLLSSTTSFQLGSSGGSRVLDAVTNAQRNFGGNKSDILDALSTSGAAAQQAGVSPEEMANIVSLIQSRTGDRGTTIAQAFDRLVSRQDNQQFRSALSGLGVQETGNVSQEIAQMSAAYQNLTTQEQQAFLASTGGARSMKDLLPLFRDGGLLVAANARSQRDAGAASEEFYKHLNSLSGQLKLVRTLLTDIATQFGQAGLFDAFGGSIKILVPALQGVNALLTEFTRILHVVPGGEHIFGLAADFLLIAKALDVMRGKFAAAAVEKAKESAVTKTSTEQEAVNSETLARNTELKLRAVAAAEERAAALATENGQLELQARLETEIDVARAGRLIPPGTSSLQTEEGIATAEGGAGRLATAGGGLLKFATNPFVLAIGGLVALGATKHAMDQFNSAADDSSKALHDLSNAKTPEALQAAAKTFGEAADSAKRSSGGIFGSLINEVRANDLRDRDQRLRAFALDESKRIAAEENANTGDLSTTVFSPSTSLASGLKEMQDQGISASTQLKTLSVVLGLVKDKANSASSALVDLGINSGGKKTPSGPTGTEKNILALAQGLSSINLPFQFDGLQGPVSADHFRVDVSKATPVIRDTLKHLGVGPNDRVTDDQISKIADGLVQNDVDSSASDQYKHMSDQARAALKASYIKALRAALQGLSAQQIAKQNKQLDDNELKSTLDLIEPQWQAAIQEASPKIPGVGGFGKNGDIKINDGSKLAALQRNVDQAKALLGRAGDKKGEAYQRLLNDANQAEDQLAQEKITELETMRQAAEAASGGNLTKLRAVRKNYFDREIRAAGDDTTAVISIFDNMTQGEINLELTVLEGAVKIKDAAVAHARAVLDALLHSPDARDPSMQGAIGEAQRDLAAALAALGGASGNYRAAKHANSSGFVTPQDSITSGDSAAQKAQETHIAYLQSLADPRNPVSQAQTALSVAQYQLSIAGKNSADYYNAVKAVNDAEYQLAQSKEQRSAAIAQSKVFPGSQLEQAASEIKTAKDELSIAEQGTADWYKAMGDLQKAQVDYAKAVLDYHHNLRLLRIDVTDPVAMAKEQLREDKAQLEHDRANGNAPDVIAADKAKNKQDSAAKENAAFSQKMQDEQTAYDLQEISANQYLRFLDHQRQRLQQIHHKTRQQIDELNQVDQAIKGLADGMNGQFNLGDIKVPTPYEARRYLASKAAGIGYDAQSSDAAGGGPMAVSTVNNHVNVTINGGDAKKLEELFRKHFHNASDRYGTKPRRI